ncbi:MAG: hypothetical protein CBE15_02415 [Euryarchaeota archaeon TMED255]|nr:MAG: hypothetical protein CBE15_02415 [Euryarchaeota archaeon TMED255]
MYTVNKGYAEHHHPTPIYMHLLKHFEYIWFVNQWLLHRFARVGLGLDRRLVTSMIPLAPTKFESAF